MANFNTHIAGGAVTSGFFASTAVSLNLCSIGEATSLWMLGTMGGIMPDIDSDNSHAVDAIFTVLAVITAFFTARSLLGLPLLYIWVAMLAVFVLVRVVILWVFKSQTIHRGAFHSLLAAVGFGVGTALVSKLGFNTTVNLAWACGLMMAIGYITHLLLDELYSVDLAGMELKRSFGSAIKPIELDSYFANALFVTTIAIGFWVLPKPELNGLAIVDLSQWQHLLLGTDKSH